MKKIEYAYLETTNYCNLDCSFCNRKDVIGPLRHMPIQNWEYLLNKIKHHPLKTAKLMGMGEPFLHPQFDEITKKFKDFFPNCFVIVATNCQYPIKLNTKMREKFEKSLAYINMLYLSIDGYEKNYERDRTYAKWDKLISFLEDLQTINRNNCNIVVNYVINAYNIGDIEKVDKLRQKYNLSTLRLNIAQIWDEKTSIKDDIATSGYTKEQFDYLKNNWGKNIMGKSEWDYNDCFWVKNGLYTTVEGNVKVCCMNTGAKSLGNIFDDTIENIHDTDLYKSISDGCKTNYPTSHCAKCSYKELIPILKKLGIQNA